MITVKPSLDGHLRDFFKSLRRSYWKTSKRKTSKRKTSKEENVEKKSKEENIEKKNAEEENVEIKIKKKRKTSK